MKGLEILDLTKATQKKKFQALVKKTPGLRIVDAFEDQLKELFLVRHPKLKFNPEEAKKQSTAFINSQKEKQRPEEQGRWIYFEWNNALVHILAEPDFFELRVSRNHNLITKEEQETLRGFRIGIAGLSVGNSIALALALEGFEKMRLADFDELSLSNLNRIRASIIQLGTNKAILTARQIYELNPYAKLELFQKGIKEEQPLKKFLAGPPKLQLLIDEMDDVIMKIRLRLIARKLRIPVLSAADNGDNAIIDVECFHLESARKIYHGTIGEFGSPRLKEISFPDKMKLLPKIVGIELVTSRMKQSFLAVGKILYAWPQLGGAAMLSGAAIAYLVKKIALHEKLPSGKYDVSLERIFDSHYDSPKVKRGREREMQDFLVEQNRIFGGRKTL